MQARLGGEGQEICRGSGSASGTFRGGWGAAGAPIKDKPSNRVRRWVSGVHKVRNSCRVLCRRAHVVPSVTIGSGESEWRCTCIYIDDENV